MPVEFGIVMSVDFPFARNPSSMFPALCRGRKYITTLVAINASGESVAALIICKEEKSN